MAEINELIDKVDSFEQIGEQIAAILAIETANQQALAIGEGKDPDLWKLRVFRERANPWEQFLNGPGGDLSPLVNVWFDNSNFDGSASNIMERQKSVTLYNIDIYGYGESQEDGTGHIPGDLDASLAAQRAIRLVRNILMSAQYTYLGLRGLVWRRWPQGITSFQPAIEGQTVQQIRGARLVLEVHFNEFSPQIIPEELAFLSVCVKQLESGEIIAEADFDYSS